MEYAESGYSVSYPLDVGRRSFIFFIYLLILSLVATQTFGAFTFPSIPISRPTENSFVVPSVPFSSFSFAESQLNQALINKVDLAKRAFVSSQTRPRYVVRKQVVKKVVVRKASSVLTKTPPSKVAKQSELQRIKNKVNQIAKPQATKAVVPTEVLEEVPAETYSPQTEVSTQTEEAKPISSTVTIGDFELTLSTLKGRYKANENINLSLQLTNISENESTLNFSSSKKYDFVAKSESGEELYRWSKDKLFTQAIEEKVYSPGEQESYSDNLRAIDLRVGKINISAEVLAQELLGQSLSFDIEVTPIFTGTPNTPASKEKPKPAELDENAQEIVERRTENAKHFKNSDGTYVARQYLSPIHYKDGDGTFKDIDTTFKPSTQSDYAYENLTNTFKTYFSSSSQENLVLIENEGTSLSFNLEGANKENLTTDKNTILYRDVLEGVDLKYSLSSTALKEEIILKEASAQNTFIFPLALSGLSYQKESDGTIGLYNSEGKLTSFFAKPFMYDSAKAPSLSNSSDDVSFDLVEGEGILYLKLTADRTWLSDPKRVYPVVIDPTIWDCFEAGDAFTSASNPNSNYGGSSQGDLRVGNGNDSFGWTKSFVRFDLSSLAGADIYQAIFYAYLFSSSDTSTTNVWVDLAQSDFNETTITENNRPNYLQHSGPVESVSGASRGWYSWDVTNHVVAKKGSILPVVMESDNEPVPGSKKLFYSKEFSIAYAPEVQISYNLPPTISSASPGPNSTVYTYRPTFSWIYNDGDADPIYNSYIEIATDSAFTNKVIWGDLGAVKSYTPLPGDELPSGTYHWRVKVTDGYSWSGYYIVSPIIIDAYPKAIPLSPSSGIYLKTHQPVFSWSYSQVGGVYPQQDAIIRITTSGSGNEYILETGSLAIKTGQSTYSLTSYRFPPEFSLPDGKYYWYVQAADSVEWGLNSAGASFIIDTEYNATYVAENNGTYPTYTYVTFPVTLTNTGTKTWKKDGVNPVYLETSVSGFQTYKNYLPSDVPAGQTVRFTAKVLTPSTTGSATLKLDLYENGAGGVSSFTNRGVVALTKSVTIQSGYKATYSSSFSTPYFAPSSSTNVTVTVTNNTSNTWSNTEYKLSYHWYDTGGKTIVWDGNRGTFLASVSPGTSTSVTVSVLAPTLPGIYILKFDIVRELVTWFSSQGVPTLDRPVVVGEPAPYLVTGNLSISATDASVSSRGPDISLSRTYNSLFASSSASLGYGWIPSYDSKLSIQANGDVIYYTGDGGAISFVKNADSTYYPPPGVYLTLTKNGTYTIKDKYSNQIKFNSSNKVYQVIDTNGNTLIFSYDASLKVTTITDASARQINLTYDANNKLSYIKYPSAAGRGYSYTSYTYDALGNLIKVTVDPSINPNDGTANTGALNLLTNYTYDVSHKLTKVTQSDGDYTTYIYDATGKVQQVKLYDKLGNLVSTPSTFSYEPVNLKATVTDAEGVATEYYFNQTLNPTQTLTKALNPTFTDDFSSNLVKWTTYSSDISSSKTATASAYKDIHLPSKVVDYLTADTDTGSTTDFWLLPDKTTGWVQIDLGQTYIINYIRFLNTHNGNVYDRATLKWHISVSADNTNFAEVAKGQENFSPNPNWVDVYVSPIIGRYVRFYVDSYYWNGGGLNELRVYGKEQEGPTPSRWAIESGQLSSTSSYYDEILTKEYFDNFAFEAKLNMKSGLDTGLLFRVNDKGEGYFFRASGYEGTSRVYLYKKDYTFLTELASASFSPPALNSDYILKIETIGSSIKAYYNGTLLITFDDRAYGRGKIGLRVYQSHTRFDDVKVTPVIVSNAYFNANHLIFSENSTSSVFNEYDGGNYPYTKGNLTKAFSYDKVSGDTSTNILTYDANNYPLTGTDSKGNKTASVYDSKGNLINVTDSLGSTVVNTYDSYGNLITTTNPISSGANLVLNPSFENAITNWTINSGSWSQDTTTSKLGKASIKVSATDAANIYVYQSNIPAKPNTTYTLSGYIKTVGVSTGTGKGTTIEAFDGPFGATYATPSLTGTKDWARYSTTFKTASSSSYITVYLYQGHNGTASGTSYFDGITLEEGPSLSPYNILENGGFERDANSDSYPDRWDRYSSGTLLTWDSTIYYNSDIASSDGHSAKISHTANNLSSYWGQTIPLNSITAGKTYTLSTFVKTAGFSDDFSDGDLVGWTPLSGEWSAEAGELSGEDGYIKPTFTAANFTLEYRAKLSLSSGYRNNLLFRADNILKNGYVVDVYRSSPSTFNTAIWKRQNGGDSYISSISSFSASSDGWYNFKLVALGSSLSFYVNGTLVVSASDSTYTQGSFAFGYADSTLVYTKIHTHYDDFKLTPAGGTGGARLGVSWFNASGTFISEVSTSLVQTQGSWQRLSLTTQAPTGAVNAFIKLQQESFNADSWFDSVRLEEGTNLTTLTYDTQGNYLIKTVDQLGNTTEALNDTVGNDLQLKAYNTSYNTITNATYDNIGRVKSKSEQTQTLSGTSQTNTTTYSYDDLNSIVTATDPLGTSSVTTKYSALGLVSETIDARGIVTTYTYNQDGDLVKVQVDPTGINQTTTYFYDDFDRAIKVVDPAGDATLTSYDSVSNKILVTDPLGNTTFITYDGKGRLTSTLDPLGYLTTSVYDKEGNLTYTIDAKGYITSYTYDTEDRVLSVTDPLGYKASTSYNTLDNSVARVDPLGNVYTSDYDTLGRLLVSQAPLGNTVTYTYDNLGNVVSSTDARGNQTTYSYYPSNKLKSTTLANGSKVTYEYDQDSRLLKTYDANANAKDDSNPTGAPLTNTYNKNLLESVVDALGYKVRYVYDNLARVTQTVFDETSLNQITKFSYYPDNSLYQVTDPRGPPSADLSNFTTTFTYYSNGNLKSRTDFRGTVSYEYYPDSKLKKITEYTTLVPVSTFEATETWNGGQADTINFKQGTQGRKLNSLVGVEYQANELPQNAAPSWTRDSNLYTGDISEINPASNLHLKLGASSWLYYTKYDDNLSNALGTIVEARHKVATGSDWTFIDNVLEISDGTYFVYLGIHSNSIELVGIQGGSQYYSLDTTAYHTYKVTLKGQDVKVYVDEQQVLSGIAFSSSTTKRIGFGDLGLSVASSAHEEYWDYLYYYIGGTQTEMSRAVSLNLATSVDSPIRIWAKIDDTSKLDKVRIILQSSINNYYYFEKLSSLLTNGWNLITAPKSEFSSTGSPSWASITLLKLQITAKSTEPVNVTFDDWHYLNGYQTTSYTYDKNDNLETVTNAEGKVTQFSYNKDNRLTQEKDLSTSYTINYTYDALGRLTKASYLSNGVTETSWQTFVYDQNSRLTKATYSTGKSISYTYDLSSNLTSVSFNGSVSASYSYGAVDELQSATNNQTAKTSSYIYDAGGNLIQEATPDSITITYSYDALGRVVSIKTAKTTTTTLATFEAGETWTKTKGQAISTDKVYYKEGSQGLKLTSTSTSGATQAARGFSPTLNLSSYTTSDYLDFFVFLEDVSAYNGTSYQAEIVFDSTGANLTNYYKYSIPTGTFHTGFNSVRLSKGYFTTAAGTPTWSTITRILILIPAAKAGATLNITFDFLRMIKEVSVTQTNYTYDGASNRTSVFSNYLKNSGFEAGLVDWTIYTGSGRSVTFVNNGSAYKGFKSAKVYDNSTSYNAYLYQTYSSAPPATYKLSFYYKGGGGSAGTTNPDAINIYYAGADHYFSLSTTSSWTLKTYTFTTSSTGTIRIYLSGISLTTGSKVGTAYFDEVILTSASGYLSYLYDKANQLTDVKDFSGTTLSHFEYDGNGNRTKAVNGTTYLYDYNQANQLTARKSSSGAILETYTYDKNGNLVSDGTYTYKYDYKNRLTEVRKKLDNSLVVSYTYDASGQRISRTNSSTTNYYFNTLTGEILAETDASGNILVSYMSAKDDIVSMTKGGVTYYFHYNAHKDVIYLTDASSNKVASWSYDNWGLPTEYNSSGAQVAVGTFGNNYLYAGYYYDPATGLYWLGARYYSPKLGRFLSPDPIGTAAASSRLDTNPYLYTANNPITRIDPTGYRMIEYDNFQNRPRRTVSRLQAISARRVRVSAHNANYRNPRYVGNSAEWASIASGFFPGYGDALDVIQVAYGRDVVAGKRLRWTNRAITAVAMVLPFVGGALLVKAAKAIKAAVVAKKVAKVANDAGFSKEEIKVLEQIFKPKLAQKHVLDTSYRNLREEMAFRRIGTAKYTGNADDYITLYKGGPEYYFQDTMEKGFESVMTRREGYKASVERMRELVEREKKYTIKSTYTNDPREIASYNSVGAYGLPEADTVLHFTDDEDVAKTWAWWYSGKKGVVYEIKVPRSQPLYLNSIYWASWYAKSGVDWESEVDLYHLLGPEYITRMYSVYKKTPRMEGLLLHLPQKGW